MQDNGPVCIVRAGDGKKKLQCVVPVGEHVSGLCSRYPCKLVQAIADFCSLVLLSLSCTQLRFHMDLFTVIKANTEALKKPKRTRTKKSKAT